MSAVSRARSLRDRRLADLRLRASPRVMAAAGLAILVLGAAWLWLRDSPLVAIQRVTVAGVSGPDAPAIRAALVARAHTMTTLDVNTNALRAAVAPYPVVKALDVSTSFPHGLTIVVHEEIPVGVIDLGGGQQLPVANDGVIMRGATASGRLPLIALAVPPGGSRLTDSAGAGDVAVLAAAPFALLGRLASIKDQPGRGIVVQVRQGPVIIFGNTSELPAKWSAAAAVLADPGSAGAAYIDVTDPGRPAAGAQPTPGSSGSVGSAGSAGSTSSGGSTSAAGSNGSAGSTGSAGSPAAAGGSAAAPPSSAAATAGTSGAAGSLAIQSSANANGGAPATGAAGAAGSPTPATGTSGGG